MGNVHKGHREQFVTGIAEDFAELLIDTQEVAVRRRVGETDRGLFECCAKALFTFRQFLVALKDLLRSFFDDIFKPAKGEKVTIMYDLPHGDIKDSDAWKERRQMAEDWRENLAGMADRWERMMMTV